MRVKVRIINAVIFFSVIVILFSPVVATAGKGCKNLTGESGQFTKPITSNGIEREYLLYVPPKYKSNRPTPLVINFHGLSQNPEHQSDLTNMTEQADKYKFILAFPLGWKPEVGYTSWNGGFCCDPAAAEGIDDVAFVSEMIDQISAEYCINPKRIFATGHSNGGIMAAYLGCELSDRVAAVASNSGFYTADTCDPSRPVPVLVLHGTADIVVPYDGGYSILSLPPINLPLPPVPNIQEEVYEWASLNGCSDETVVTYQKGDVTCVTYEDCEDDASVTLCTIEGGGHTWPGSDAPYVPLLGYTTQDINASRAIWKFFAEHSMPDNDDDDDDD